MAKQTKKVPDEISGRDELASLLADSLNKQFKDFKAAHFLSGEEDTPTDLTEWVGTGSTLKFELPPPIGSSAPCRISSVRTEKE